MRACRFISIALLALLAACGPPQPYYRTDIELVAPPTEMGRMCANNCLMAQQNCQQSCMLQQQSCRQQIQIDRENARRNAENDYRDYVRERSSQGKLIKKSRSDFERYISDSCATDSCNEQCTGHFHICYANCGGQVIPHTVCVANCHLISPQQQSMVPGAY